MPTPLRVDGLLVKTEVTYATDAAPVAGTDGVRTSERMWSSMRIEHVFPNERTSTSASILPIAPGRRVGRIVNLELAWDARGAGAAYSASVLPEADPLFKACGMSRADDFTASSENVIYTQADTGHDSATIWVYAANKVFKLVGARGNCVWPVAAGIIGVIRFQMQGLLLAAPTEIAVPAITYDSTIPPPATGMTLSIGAFDPDVVTAEFNQNAGVARLDSANNAQGVAEFAINAADPSYTFAIKTDTLANYDPFADAEADPPTARAIDWVLGATQYNRINLNTTAAYVLTAPGADQEGFTGYDLQMSALEFAIKFD